MTLDKPVNGSIPAIRSDYTGHPAKGETHPLQSVSLLTVVHLKGRENLLDSPLLYSDTQSVCGFSCSDIVSMFKELKGLGVVVKKLSNDLRKVVSVSTLSYFSLPFILSAPSFPRRPPG